jgi:hypothetical protein
MDDLKRQAFELSARIAIHPHGLDVAVTGLPSIIDHWI